jgi:deazaflavin-dependent oxidoreductase (nitroreductase family)
MISSGVVRRPAETRTQLDKPATRWRASGLYAMLKALGTLHRLLYRASRGRLARVVRGAPVLLLTTTGCRSGRSRTWPVCYLPAGDGDVIVVASAGGAPRHPGWYVNLRANSMVTVQLGDRTCAMCARTAEGVEGARLWERVVQQYPVCATYQRKTGRVIPVVVLSPILGTNGNALLFAKG